MANVAENNADPWGRSLIETLRRWWWVAMAAAVIGAGVGLAAGVNSPRTAEAMLAVQIASNRFEAKGERPALLVAANYRPVIRAMTERAAAQTPVISYQEVARNSVTRTVETIGK